MNEKTTDGEQRNKFALLSNPEIWRVSTVKLLIALILLFALTPRKGVKLKPQFFEMMLARVGRSGAKHWVVTYWAPYSHPQVPSAPN